MIIPDERVPPYPYDRSRSLVSELRVTGDYPRFEVIGLDNYSADSSISKYTGIK